MKAMVILLTLWTIVRLRLDDPRVNNADVGFGRWVADTPKWTVRQYFTPAPYT